MSERSARPPKSPRAQWLMCRDEVEYGPFTSRQLQLMAGKGDLLPSDFIWKEGMKDWVSAASTSITFPVLAEGASAVILPSNSKHKPVDPDLQTFLNGTAESAPKKATVASPPAFTFQAGDEAEAESLENSSSDTEHHGPLDEAALASQTKFVAVTGESIYFQAMAAWSEGIATHSGTVILSSRRIAFCQPAGFDGGLLLLHTINLATRAHDQIVWQVLLPYITSVHRKKYLGFGRKTVFSAKDGTSYAVDVKGEAWRTALQSVGIKVTDSTGDPPVEHPRPTGLQLANAVPEPLIAEPQAGDDFVSDEEWHVNAGGENYGPIGYAELLRMVQAGTVGADDLVWKDGFEKWALASSVPGLVPVVRKPKGPPPITEVERPPNGFALESLVLDTVRTARKSAARVSHAKPVKGFHVQRIVVGIASGLGIISTFLPWARLPIVGTIDGTFNGDGWLTLGLYAVAVVCIFREPHGQMLAGRPKLAAGLCSILASLIGLYTLLNIGNARRAIDDDNLFGAAIKGSFRTGIGLYLVVLCGIVAGLAVFALPQERQRRK